VAGGGASESARVHNFDFCLANTEEARTFYRRDHLVQHLRQVHRVDNVSDMQEIIQRWHRPAEPLNSKDPALHCGFCGVWLKDWENRVAHVSKHIENGSSTQDWWPDHWWPERLEPAPNFPAMLSKYPLELLETTQFTW
jgi:hypothetical protein